MKVRDDVPHPLRRTGRRDTLHGCRLEVGDRLKVGDRYASSTPGEWLEVGESLDGFVIGPGDPTVYVRPANPPRVRPKGSIVITVEGPQGSGKSLIADSIAEALRRDRFMVAVLDGERDNTACATVAAMNFEGIIVATKST